MDADLTKVYLSCLGSSDVRDFNHSARAAHLPCEQYENNTDVQQRTDQFHLNLVASNMHIGHEILTDLLKIYSCS